MENTKKNGKMRIVKSMIAGFAIGKNKKIENDYIDTI